MAISREKEQAESIDKKHPPQPWWLGLAPVEVPPLYKQIQAQRILMEINAAKE